MATTENGTANNGTANNGIADIATGGAGAQRLRTRGGLVTAGTVVALVAAMGATLFGLGAADHAVASYDASSWLWSSAKSEMARVNGVTSRVDTRLQVPKAQGHSMQVTQTDRFLILRDLNTGQVSSLDLATLQVTAMIRTTAGFGVSVALHDDAAFVVDAVQGIVRQFDPRSLVPIGEPVRFPPGITGGAFDGDGRLWLAVPSEGTVSAITAAPLPSAAAPSGGTAGGLSPTQVRTLAVADPSHDLAISTLDSGVAVLDRTTSTLTTVRGDDRRTVRLALGGLGALPVRTNGAQVPVTVPDSRQVYAVADGGVRQFAVPGDGARLRPAVAWAEHFYCADDGTGTVYVFDATGKLVEKIDVKGANGPLELEVRENYLFINAPNSSTARVVNDKHQVRVVDKYANDILGGDPPPASSPPPPPKKPIVGKPGAPRSVTASAGNAQVRVSWRPAAANGSAITRYVVEGDGKTYQVGANQRSLEITGLVNGQSYRFSVHAVNAKGDGPARMSNRVVPTADVPDAPASVTAQERPDGSVVVKWPAANGQGYKITKYAVSAISAGASAPVGESVRTELVIPAGELDYGTQYAFSVVAINQKGAGSKASPLSNSVVPFTLPGRPASVEATTVGSKPGTIRVTWGPAAENGRAITKYVVDAGGKKTDVTDGTAVEIGGFGDGQNIAVKVRAVNEAGAGPEATTSARTVAKPQVTITGSSAAVTSVTVSFTVDAGGGQANCTLAVAGGGSANGNCGRLTVGNLAPGTNYNFTVTATNAAGNGTAAGSQATDALYGIATCNNGASGDTATYCDADVSGRNGNEIFSVTRQDNNKQVGWAKPGTRLKAYCKARGEEVYAYIYNNHKRSTWWVRVEYAGRNYIPWAWLNLENGDDINVLPNC